LNLERMLAFHCAPTLVGLKPANLIAHELMHTYGSQESYETTRQTLIEKGIYMEQLQTCNQRELTLVYNKVLLQALIEKPEIWGYLFVQGYPMYSGFDRIIEHLKKRIVESGGFPHEVGVFLGYPLVDVLGFIKNKGQNCKFCGYWKVYGDEEQARCLFESFSKVRDEIYSHIEQGLTIAQYLEVA